MLRSLIIALAMISPAHAAGDVIQFRVSPSASTDSVRILMKGGQYEIFASGEIDADAPDRFQRFVDDNAIKDAIVLFDSPGGSLLAGLNLGKLIRSMGFDTGVGSYGPRGRRLSQGTCASACAYAFAGGKYRFYSGENERLGIHQFYSLDTNQADVGDVQIVSSLLISYLQSMGVDPQAFVVASTARQGSMLWLTTTQANSLGLSNNGSDPTVTEIKMSGTIPYLKIEQNHFDVMARVLLTCEPDKYPDRFLLMAGIVTNPELSTAHQASLVRNYLETDSREILIEKGRAETSAENSVLWLYRNASKSDISSLLMSNKLGIWTENNGPMRWGATIDLRPARDQIITLIQNCSTNR